MEAHRKIMKKFSIIHIPVLSFFSKELYRDVGLYWKGVNFSYLLLLLAICWIPTMIKIHIGFSDFINNEVPAVVEQVPEITITNGEVSISEPQPYYIKDPQNGDVLAIIDTTGTIKSLEDPNAICLLTKTNIMWRQVEFETRTIDLSEVKNFVLDSERIMGWLHTARKFLIIIIYPFALLGSYLYRIVQALIYAAVGLLFALWCKVTLSYATLLRLAVVAVTPCVLVKTILGIAGVHLPYAGLIYLVAALAYLFFGVHATAQTTGPQQETQFPQQMGI
jgi:hypothetical protein